MNAFISYSSKDKSIAAEIASQLEKRGHHVWLDRESISIGEQWDVSIAQGLGSAKVFILLLSPNSVKSKYVKKEFIYACSMKLKILPVVVKSLVLPEEWKFNLGRKQMLYYEAEPKLTIDRISEVLTRVDRTLYLDGELVDTLINEQIRIISYWLRRLAEQGSACRGDHVIFIPADKRSANIYIQAAKMSDGNLLLEASSRLCPPLSIDDSMNERLIDLGWTHPATVNYSRTIRIEDKDELDNAANFIILTFMTVYGIDPNESILVEYSL